MTCAIWDELRVAAAGPRARTPPARPLGQQDAADLAAADGDAQLVGGLDHGVQGPLGRLLLVLGGKGPVGLPDQPTRWSLADQGDELPALGLAQPAWPARSGQVAESAHAVGVAAVQPLPHGLGVAPQRGGDLGDALAVPAAAHDAGAQDPVAGRVTAGGEPADGALLVGVGRRSGKQQRRHRQWLRGSHPRWTGTDGAFNYTPILRNAALGSSCNSHGVATVPGHL
jgi:hypothetical protein